MYSQSMDLPFYADFTRSFKKWLQEETSMKVEFSYESLDLFNYTSDDTLSQAKAEVLRLKYQNARPDIIVTHSMDGVTFLNRYCSDIFGMTPVIAYFTRPAYIETAVVQSNYTYCFPLLETAKTVQLILATLPNTQELYVVMGKSEEERRVREELPQQLAEFSGRLTITYLDNLSMSELLDRIRAIKGQAAILFVDYRMDAQGTGLIPARVIRAIAAESPVPVFGSYSTHLDGGGIGGYVLNMSTLGREVGQRASAILQGADVQGKTELMEISEYRVDWRELERWKMDEDKFPRETIFLNKPLSLWQSYKWHIIIGISAAVLVMVLQTALIALQRRKRRIAEKKAALKAKLIVTKEDIIRDQTLELHETKERFQQIFHDSSALISIVRMEDNTFVEVNRKFLDVIEYTREEVIGRTPEELNFRVEEEKKTQFIIADLLRKGEIENYEYKIRTKSGLKLTIVATAALINIGGEQCCITTMQDRTAEKKLEDDLARLDQLNLVGEMAAGIGHEVRNPMTTVRGYLQLFSRKQDFLKYHEQITTMIEELDRANAIITEFLSLAKDKIVEMKHGNLNQVIHSLLPLIQADAYRLGHEIQAECGDIPDNLYDEKEIRQLILNLVRNALEAMKDSGNVVIRTYQWGEGFVLEVQDTGIGIPDEVMDKLGTPFVTTKDGGTGLGLSVCYRIAGRHNAKIDVETGSQGTTFTVIFNDPEVYGNRKTAL